MSLSDLFSAQSAQYAAARPSYPAALFAFVAQHAPALGHAWDCGTGNGQAAVGLAAHFATVSASDPSAAQIAQARPWPNVRYSVQPAEQTCFPAQAFDAICVAQALHWFDLPAFYAEVRRTARPGALVCAWGYAWFTVAPAVDAAFQAHVRNVIAPYWASQNRLLWAGYRDLPFPFAHIAAPTLQIDLRWNLHQLLAYVRTWSATQRCVAAQGPAFLQHAAQALADHWGDPAAARAVTMPLHVLAGRVAAAPV